MADLNRQVLIHLHNSANTLSDPSKLEFGELALLHNNDSAATIYAKYLDGETEKLAEFGTKQYVQIKINEAQSDLEGKLNNLSGATMNLEDAVEEFSASTVAEFIRVDGAVESLSAGTIAEIGRVDGRIDNLSASTIAIETIANGALQSISKGEDGDYVTTTIGAEDENHDQSVAVAVKVQAMATADSASSETMGLAEASDVKAYVDGEIEKAVADVTALSGAVEAFSAEVYTNYATKEEVATASANSITSANSYTDAASANIETTINALSAGTEAEIANTFASAKTYTDDQIDTLDGSATIATVADGVVTLKAGVSEVNGVIDNATDSDITLAKVATTGDAVDVNVTDTAGKFTATTVEDVLLEINNRIDAQQGGMRYNGGISTATATVNTSTNDVRPGDIYLATDNFSIGTISVETGDMIVYKGASASTAVALDATNCNVIEKESDLMVTADGTLTDGYLVMGKGNKSVAVSSLTIADVDNAIKDVAALSAATVELENNALYEIKTGSTHDYVTTNVGAKANHEQTVDVAVATQAVSTATAAKQGLADAYDVKTYVDGVSGNIETTINAVSGNIENTINTVSGNIESTINAFSGAVVETYATSADTVDYIKEVSGNIESTINALSNDAVKSVDANSQQDNYVVVAVDNTDAQNPRLSATVQTAVVTSAMTASTEGILESDSLVNIKAYVDNKAETEANTAYENAVASANSYTDSALTEYLKDVKIAVDDTDGYNASAGVTATKNDATKEVKINFKDMIIDCGTY